MSEEKLHEDKYYLSPSALVDMEKEEYCPKKWKAKWVDKTLKREPSTDVQNYGHYYEYLVTGETSSDGIKDLPRKKNGDKTIVQLRLEEQAEWAKKFIEEKYDIIGYQVRLYDNDRLYNGILDILAICKETGRSVDLDLKTTSDVEATHGPYSWGNHIERDYIQSITYGGLIKEKDVRSDILVVDYSPRLGRKYIQIDLTEDGIKEMQYRYEVAREAIEYYDEYKWSEDPSPNECNNCSLIECKSRYKPSLITEKLEI